MRRCVCGRWRRLRGRWCGAYDPTLGVCRVVEQRRRRTREATA